MPEPQNPDRLAPIDQVHINELRLAFDRTGLYDYFFGRIVGMASIEEPSLDAWRVQYSKEIIWAVHVATNNYLPLSLSQLPELEDCARQADNIVYPAENKAQQNAA